MKLTKLLSRAFQIGVGTYMGVCIGGVGIVVAGTAIGISGAVWGTGAGVGLVCAEKFLNLLTKEIEDSRK